MSLCSSMVMVREHHNIEMPILGVREAMSDMSNPSLLSTFLLEKSKQRDEPIISGLPHLPLPPVLSQDQSSNDSYSNMTFTNNTICDRI